MFWSGIMYIYILSWELGWVIFPSPKPNGLKEGRKVYPLESRMLLQEEDKRYPWKVN